MASPIRTPFLRHTKKCTHERPIPSDSAHGGVEHVAVLSGLVHLLGLAVADTQTTGL